MSRPRRERPRPPAGPEPLGAARVELPGPPFEDWVVREEPLLIEVEGESVLTMRTPGADEDLALGFLLGEGVIGSLAEVKSVARHPASGTDPRPTGPRPLPSPLSPRFPTRHSGPCSRTATRCCGGPGAW